VYPYRKETEAVIYLTEPVPRLDSSALRHLVEQSNMLLSPGPVRLCVHPTPSADFHEMYIVHRQGNYLRPHRHTDKDEAGILLEGEMDVFLFNDAGDVTERICCGNYLSGQVFHVRIPQGIWHCQVVRSPYVLFYEATTGPFNREKMEFAPFSPEVGADESENYFKSLLEIRGQRL